MFLGHLAPIKCELSEMIIIFKIKKKKNLKQPFFGLKIRGSKQPFLVKTTTNIVLVPRLNTKDTIFHLGAIYLLYWQLEMCYKYENLTLLSLRTMLELGALYLIMRLMQCRNDRFGLSLLLNLVSMNYNDHMSWMHWRHLTIIRTLMSLIVT